MLETVVRPYEAPQPISTDTIVTQRALVPSSRARLRWGAVGALPPATTHDVHILDCDDKYQERQSPARTTNLVKVVNPDDSSQYVIVESLASIFFSKKSKDDITISYQKTQVLYGPPQLAGALQPKLIFQMPNSDAQVCQTEYDFLNSFPQSQLFQPF